MLASSEQFGGPFKIPDNINTYISYLLCIIFASFPLSVERFNRKILSASKDLVRYSFLQHSFQWGSGILLATYVVGLFSDNTGTYLGSILPAGFAGGHGSSAVIGSIFDKKGFPEVFTLAMMMATIGAFFSLFGGLVWIYFYKGSQNFNVAKPARATVPQLRIFIFFILIVTMSFILKIVMNKVLYFDIPMLATGVGIGLLVRFAYKNIHALKDQIENFVNITTTVLVCLGIAAIKVVIVKEYFILILILALFTLAFGVLIFKFVGLKFLGQNSFEKSLFTWGWSIGGIVFGLSLVEIVKNQNNASLLQILGVSYLLISPFEIVLILTMPAVLLSKYGVLAGICLLSFAGFLMLSIIRDGSKSLKS